MSVANSLRDAGELAPSTPKQVFLPPRSGALVGRTKELEEIRSLLEERGSGARILVYGQGGVGKSAIVLSLAHEQLMKSTYQLVAWLDCDKIKFSNGQRAKSPGAAHDLSEMVRGLAHIAKSEAALRSAGVESIAALRTRLGEMRGLVIVDGLDAVDSREAEQFILSLPHTIDVIATSKRNLSWDCRVRIAPWGYNSEAARQFLQQQLRQWGLTLSSDEEQAALANGHGIALGISWCAFLLTKGSTVAKLADHGTEGWRELREHSFEAEWRRAFAEPRMRRAATCLAMAGAMKPEDLERICSLSSDERGATAAFLMADSSYAELGNQEVRIAPYAREFILEKVKGDTALLKGTIKPWLANLLSRTQLACQLPTWKQAFDVIDTFREEMINAIQWTKATWRRAVPVEFLDLTEVVAYYFYSRGSWDDYESWEAVGIEQALRKGRYRYAIEVGLFWGVRIRHYRSSSPSATAYFERIVSRIPYETDRGAMAAIISVASTFLRGREAQNGDVASRMERHAEHLLRLGEQEWACRAMLHAGNVWSELGDTTNAGRAYEWLPGHAIGKTAIPVLPWMSEMKALSVGSLGILANRKKQSTEAARLLKISIEGLVQTYDLASANGEYAYALNSIGNNPAARNALRSCVELKNRLGVAASVMETQPGWEMSSEAEALMTSLSKQSAWSRIFGGWA